MNLIETFSRISKASRYLVVLLFLITLVEADGERIDVSKITDAMRSLCNTSVTLLGGSIVVLIVVAALVYAAGQIMGAETRARATVWATAMITGAIIGAILYIVLPSIIAAILGVNATPSDPCNFTVP